MNKPIYVTSEADCVRMIGNQVFFTGWNLTQTIRHFAIGKETAIGSRMIIINNMEGELLLTSGKRSGNANFGQNKIITQSTGISLRRGGRTDAEITVGEIGATGGTSDPPDANLYINGNSMNNIIIDAGLGQISLKSQTNMSKPLFINSSGEGLRNHGYISSYDSTLNTRDWYIGTPDGATKTLNIINEKAGAIVINSGSDGVTSISGNNIINTISGGVAFSRNYNNNYTSGGVIGLINSTNNVFHITSNGLNDIYMSSGSGTTTITTTNNINLSSNTVYIGSITPAGNGYKTNLNFLEASGYATQSSAFTETLKTQVLNSSTNYTTINTKFTDVSTFWNSTGKRKIFTSTNAIIGLPDPLPATSSYSNLTTGSSYYNVGILFYNGGLTDIFFSNGRYKLSTPMRFNISIELDFDSYIAGEPPSGFGTSVPLKIMESRIRINDAGAEIDGTMWSGIHLTGYIPSNKNIRYRLTINCIFYYGYEIILQTYYDFTTGTSGYTGARMAGTFILERQVL